MAKQACICMEYYKDDLDQYKTTSRTNNHLPTPMQNLLKEPHVHTLLEFQAFQTTELDHSLVT